MGSNSNDDNEKVINSEVFLRELNLTDEEQSILAKVIAVLAIDYAQSTLTMCWTLYLVILQMMSSIKLQ